MGAVMVDGQDAPAIESVEEMAGRFTSELMTLMGGCKQGLPLGSGAIESGIRRVINLRLKSNAIFWREPNAESMLQVRAQVISNRWDQRVQEMRNLRRPDGLTDWTWRPQPMSVKTEAKHANAL